jgi:hydroxyacylglutathione hydrolase
MAPCRESWLARAKGTPPFWRRFPSRGTISAMNERTIFLEQMELGPMQNFVYLIGDPLARACVVVDPAWEIDTIVERARAADMTIVGALVTHTHQDHVGGSLESWGMPGRIPGVEELLEQVPAKVYVHKAEREFVKGLGSDLVAVDNHDTVNVGRLTITVLHTPGHTPGSQCFLVDGRLVSGDTLFIGSCGRTDLPGSDPSEMYYSLTQRLAALPDDTVLFPGHNYGGPSSSLGAEKRANPFMRKTSLAQFLRVMGGGRSVLP